MKDAPIEIQKKRVKIPIDPNDQDLKYVLEQVYTDLAGVGFNTELHEALQNSRKGKKK